MSAERPAAGEAPALLTAGQFRRAMGQFQTGVTVVSTPGSETAHAMTANAFTSVSLQPPMVLVCVAHRASFHSAVLAAGVWAVSILAADQTAVAEHFATSGRVLATQFDHVDHVSGPLTGAPLLGGALAWLECRTTQIHVAGDHSVLFGDVLSAVTESADRAALTYHRGSYHAPGTLHR